MANRVKVRGHYRKDGSYDQPHYRTTRDKSCQYNYGYPGNINPNTFEVSQGDPWSYTQRCRRKRRARGGFNIVSGQ